MSLGDNIKKIRKHKKMTQTELANEMNISRSYLGDLENNRRNPSSATLEKLSEKLDVGIDYLLLGKSSSITESTIDDLLELSKELVTESSKVEKEDYLTFINDIDFSKLNNNQLATIYITFKLLGAISESDIGLSHYRYIIQKLLNLSQDDTSEFENKIKEIIDLLN